MKIKEIKSPEYQITLNKAEARLLSIICGSISAFEIKKLAGENYFVDDDDNDIFYNMYCQLNNLLLGCKASGVDDAK